MARIIQTAELTMEEQKALPRWVAHQLYNGLDAAVTGEILVNKSFQRKLTQPGPALIYNFERAMQGPAMTMMLRGMAVDADRRDILLVETGDKYEKVESWIRQLSFSIWEQDLNPRSNNQLQDIFYNWIGLPKKYKKRDNGEMTLTVDREALEGLAEMHIDAVPLITALLKLEDLEKQLQVLRSGIDSDMRMRFSFNVASAETGRWSSSKNAFGGGTNFQNLNEDMRKILVADKGWKLFNIDLKQAESFGVAYYSGDLNYLNACDSGDLHTYVSRLVWPKLPWTGDIKKDKKIAERPLYRHFTYRDMAKRGGHLTNYLGSPWKMAKVLHLTKNVAEEFQENYFSTFPGIRNWHHALARQLLSLGAVTTVLGRERQFTGRRDSESTLRELVAHLPQSTIVDIVNLGLYRVWKQHDIVGSNRCQLFGQVHDSIVGQYREEDPEFPHLARQMLEIPITFPGQAGGYRSMQIPAECSVGYVWNKKLLVEPGTEAERNQKRERIDFLDIKL